MSQSKRTSKAKQSPAKSKRRNTPFYFRAMQHFVRGRVEEIKEHLQDPALISKGLPPAIQSETSAAAAELAWEMLETMPELAAATVRERTGVRVVASLAVHLGFCMAIHRFADSLQGVPELSKWQEEGLKKGHATQSQTRAENYQHIREKWAAMEAAGLKPTNDSVAAAIRGDGRRCSRSTVIRAFKSEPAKRAKR